MNNVFDGSGFSETLSREFKDVYQGEPEFWCNVFDAQIEKVDDSAVEIFLEGSAVSSIITDISQFFENDERADVHMFSMADYEYYFSIYSKEEGAWQELTYSMKENFNELLNDSDLTLQSKFH